MCGSNWKRIGVTLRKWKLKYRDRYQGSGSRGFDREAESVAEQLVAAAAGSPTALQPDKSFASGDVEKMVGLATKLCRRHYDLTASVGDEIRRRLWSAPGFSKGVLDAEWEESNDLMLSLAWEDYGYEQMTYLEAYNAARLTLILARMQRRRTT